MKYRVFNTEAEAIAAEALISQEMGYTKPGINAATGEVVPDALTTRWAISQQIADGRWMFPSPDDVGGTYDENGQTMNLLEIILGYHVNTRGILPEQWQQYLVSPRHPVRIFF